MSTRLFDFVRERYDSDPDATMLVAKEGGKWREYSTREVWETACSVSRGLLKLGVDNAILTPEAQEKIAIISPNRPEWVMTDLAVQMTGGVLTPIYPTIAEADLEFVLKEADVKKIFIASADLYERFASTISANPGIKHIFLFDNVPGQTQWKSLAG